MELVDTLGEDLVLLAIEPDRGTIAARNRLPYGLRGPELVRLAASGRIGITGNRIVVLDDAARAAAREAAATTDGARARASAG